MKILFVVEKFTKEVNDGYTLRTYNICKHLKNRNNQIFIVNMDKEQNFKFKCNSFENDLLEKIILIPMEYYNTNRGKLYKFLSSFFPFIYYKPQEVKSFHEKIKTIIRHNKIDLIHVQGHYTGLNLMKFQDIPKLLDMTDSMTLYYNRRFRMDKNWGDRLKSLFYSKWCKHIEKRLLENYKIITVVSENDLLTLKKIDKHSLVENIQNGIDTDFFYPIYQEEDYPSIFFHGTMDFKPNIDAVMYIYNQILPIIKKEVPNLKFFIIGNNPTSDIKKLNNNKDIIVTGKVEDIRSYISKCDIALMPMKSGSGIKNKILEAMAMEKPVVTNLMGAESFDYELKNMLLIGKTELELAQYVVKLLKNHHIRQMVGKESRKLVKKYSWCKTSQEYENLYKKLLDL